MLAEDEPSATSLAQPVDGSGILVRVQADFPLSGKVQPFGVELVKVQAVGVGLGDGQHLGFVAEGATEFGNLL